MNHQTPCGFILATTLACGVFAIHTPLHAKKPHAVITALEQEVERNLAMLSERGDPAPYFIGYYAIEYDQLTVSASNGALATSARRTGRLLDADVRVGDYAFDNTHPVAGTDPMAYMRKMMRQPASLPMGDDVEAIRSAIWEVTDKRYKEATEDLIRVRSKAAISVEAEDSSDDFSREPAVQYLSAIEPLRIDEGAWQKRILRASARLTEYPQILDSAVELRASRSVRYIVNSEGTRVAEAVLRYRVLVYAMTVAEDGMDLFRHETYNSVTEGGLPSDDQLAADIAVMAADLKALLNAPVLEPYEGPAILSGRAAGVFFHEIFGHRIEGHRQKDDDEGQTFTKKVNQQILPDFISVYDDPTLEKSGDTDLNGFYRYDDEGVPARRVTVVENGILRNFLTSRTPLKGFPSSNGHGRKTITKDATGRQGNLIVEASLTVSEEALKTLLIEECKKRGKEFGLYFADISGGFTFTGRYIPQSFKVSPLMVYRIYTDGREELVRGVDLIGTPLVSFSEIRACGNRTQIFNGTCGAESGWVPVSAMAPSVFTAQIEIQKKEKGSDRPPLLAAPKRKGESL